jgi:hypothetical protein
MNGTELKDTAKLRIKNADSAKIIYRLSLTHNVMGQAKK